MRWSSCVVWTGLALWWGLGSLASKAADAPATARGDRMIAEYFRQETARLRDTCLADVKTLEQWQTLREQYRRELFDMLGLDPLPPKTDLHATVTGTTEHAEFVVEQVQFQSRPGLYVTGNFYRPKQVTERLPAILYLCGHAQVKKDGVSLGNKAYYQHHGAWFARHGYCCLTIDSLQLGEIEGIHHGTYRYGSWWWLNRGYTPAGVEAWNCIRALDYLQSRPEVDPERLGATGRSGGGAYSWWIAALDERIRCAVPVAGITDLENHVVDGAVEGHCDCMFFLNTFRWDYPAVAALVAPRPLLISNTDRDPIFPLEGVVRTHRKARDIYRLYGAADKLALQITAGPHHDTQELHIHAFRWFDQWLKRLDRPIEKAALKLLEPAQLRVFLELPADQQNTKIDESFVAAAPPPAVPADAEAWKQQAAAWRQSLLERSFRAWPAPEPLALAPAFSVERHGVKFAAYDFTSQGPVRLRLYVAHRADLKKADLAVLNVLDAPAWTEFLATLRPGFEAELKDEALPPADDAGFKELQGMFRSFAWVMAYVAPRGIGPTAWDASEKKQTQHRRRFYLLGQTLDGMQVWDVRRAVQAFRAQHAETPLWLQSHRQMAGITLYASLFEPDITRLDLYALPRTHREGPIFLNVQRTLEMPAAVALAAERSKVVLFDDAPEAWQYPRDVAEKLSWDKKQLQIRKPPQ